MGPICDQDARAKYIVRNTFKIMNVGISHSNYYSLVDEDNRFGRGSRDGERYTAAHELRTPVAILQGRLEAARDDVLPLGADGLSALVDQTRLLGRLIDDLKTLSLADAGQLALHRRAVDVGALTSSVVRGFEAAAAASQVTLQVDVVTATTDGDPDRLVQVVVILLDNALRHTPASGEIHVRVSVAAAAVLVAVGDTGPGVPAGGGS